jgi:hypothetical protein
LQMPMMTVGLMERVLITLPHAQRISESKYLGCISALITKVGKPSSAGFFDKR